MRVLPAGLQSHLDSGITTLCHCWRLVLASGETLGFTDHDVVLAFEGTTFEAQAGFTGSDIETQVGFAVDNLEATGALQSGKLDAARLNAGDFDHAAITIWRVNWMDVSQRLRLRTGHLGEVTLANGAFTAEVRGLSHLLGQPNGRLYQFGCDAELGDTRCAQNLDTPTFRTTATVIGLSGDVLSVASLGFADAWANHGRVQWLTGQGAGRSLAIKRHWLEGGAAS